MEILYIWTSFPGCSQQELLTLSEGKSMNTNIIIDNSYQYHYESSEPVITYNQNHCESSVLITHLDIIMKAVTHDN